MQSYPKNEDVAWVVPPQNYADTRPAIYSIPEPESRYLTMRDGCRLAIDVYVPQSPDKQTSTQTPAQFPAIVLFTPYYRRFKLKTGGAGERAPNTAKFRDFFVPRGYVVVVIDVRGTGASFGTRDSFRSPREREDSREVVDWIVKQPWSSGVVGATGISYLGAASDFLASTRHPAVKAIAPLFSVWDTYTDNYFPGGIQLKALTQSYDDLMVALDHDRRDMLHRFVYYANPDFDGPQPVDEDPEGKLLKDAIHQHLGNFRQTEFMPEFRFREDPLPYDPEFSSATFSPYSLAEQIPHDVAVLSVSGWMDGGGYMNGAISRFLTLSKNPRHLLLGPWDHGARIDVSPWRTSQMADFPWLAEILRFFDHYLLGKNTGLDAEDPVHYYAIHAEQWRSAPQWPPYDKWPDKTLYLTPNSVLESFPESDTSHQDYHVDFAIGTGSGTRYERIAAINSTEYYPDWQGRTDLMCSFTSAPLRAATELAGHVVADLWVSSSEPDAALFVYLTEIEADGRERYVTEGMLRLLHRRVSPCPLGYQTTWPFRTFSKQDALPLVPGQFERISVPLLPTAWQFQPGSRIRISIAGADKDHCGQVPHGRPPILAIGTGGEHGSRIEFPFHPFEQPFSINEAMR
ncbi:CocE/NonD family hydrolase [Achromobacter seleniivolatilans]|uniref:CocE/NonD family hydrolase n=1 Tax=Achromobacter seleniivolatilans TaxID=3047478 RepID=A0ABY9M5Y3_9BURK|nr:CocE/NonD family hydrolase [Achromobacter sp. R39]WMD22122.1 CocE/NonD family hydrolase [Achromobacter sp. R39]